MPSMLLDYNQGQIIDLGPLSVSKQGIGKGT